VQSVTRREVQRRPPPPLITSTLQQAASRYFGFTPSRTMQIAQRLYEGVDIGEGPVGLITYMRTDSVRVAEEARKACRELIAARFGAEYVPARPNVYRSRPGAQEAHEAIRPTEVSRHPDDLRGKLREEEWKLYNLVWRRFVASQMAPAKVEQVQVDITAERAGGEKQGPEELRLPYTFHAAASRVLFPGFLRVMEEKEIRGTATSPAGDEAGDDQEEGLRVTEPLPPLAKDDPLRCLGVRSEEKETRPPPRYTEATLVRALEQNGVGRPSTYAQIISTLYARRYVVKEKRALKPTRLGEQVNEFLVKHLGPLFEVGFTARMEEELDRIERGEAERREMLEDFYRKLRGWLAEAKGPPADPEAVRRLLELLAGVKEWRKGPGQKRSRDEGFVSSIRRRFESGQDGISEAQFLALARIAARYREQVPEIVSFLNEQGLQEMLQQEERKADEQARNEEMRVGEKLAALAQVQFEPPRRVGRRVFDDRRFVESLRRQAEAGRALTENQVRYLDRLLLKYADQMGGREAVVERFGIRVEEPENEAEVRQLLESLASVEEWEPPRRVRGREWSDRAFYESVRRQFESGKTLSPRQVKSLRRLVEKYGRRSGGAEADGGKEGEAQHV